MTNSLLFPDMDLAPAFEFPQPLTEKYRPATIAGFAGLAEVKKSLAGYINRPRDCGMLFVGSAGTGKTSMGIALANELRAFVTHVPAKECTLARVRDIAFHCWYVPPQGYTRHLILIDEMDLASLDAQNAILSYLDGTETIPGVTWIFTCNDTTRLADRFMSRCRILQFSTYAIQADAAKLLESVWDREAQPTAPKPNFARMIKDALGNVRAALQVLESRLDSASI